MTRRHSSAILLLFAFIGNAQVDRHMNYRKYDDQWFNFGFSLGMNSAGFHHSLEPDHFTTDSLVSLTVDYEPGFNFGFVTSLKLAKWLRLRFVPSLSFQERTFNFSFVQLDDTTFHQPRLESTNLDFPLLLKLRTLRMRNFAVFALFGGQYSFDMQSQQNTQQNPFSPIMKIKASDWAGQVGGGFDIWFEYFKFGVELKLSYGLVDALVHDDTRYISPISKLYTKTWWIAVTFEGCPIC